MDFSEVKYFKIHPAIGVARIANNEDYFEFFEAHKKGFSPAKDYMSGGAQNDPEPGKLRIKRQAVRFKVFAYGENDNLIGEVNEKYPGIQTEWSATISNRKLHNYASKKDEAIPAVVATGKVRNPDRTVELNGLNPWHRDQEINLGAITGKGLFIPAKGGVFRKEESSKIDKYPAKQDGELQCTDTTADGQIEAVMMDENGQPISKPVLAAWVVSAPPQHSLTLTPVMAQEMKENFGTFDPENANNNKDWIIATKKLLKIQGDVSDPTGLDLLMMGTLNADYKPGMEVNLKIGRMETGLQPEDLFYERGSGFIGSNEIRVKPKNESTTGALPGQLSSGLCSTWQGDMMMCLNWWTAENPSVAYGKDGSEEVVIYKEDDPNTMMKEPEEINQHMDFRGIVDYKKEGDDLRLDLVFEPKRPSNG